MVLVCVRYNHGCDFILDFSHIVKIRDYNIHAVHSRIRKAHTHIDDNRTRVVLDDGDVAADFAKPADGRNADFVRA